MTSEEYGRTDSSIRSQDVKRKSKGSKKPPETLLSGVDFVVDEFCEIDKAELRRIEKESKCDENIFTYSAVQAEYDNIRRFVKGIDENFELLPVDVRFNKLAELRDRGGMDEQFAKIAVLYFTYCYIGGILKYFKSYINSDNRMDFIQEANKATINAFKKYVPGMTSNPLQYFGKIVYEAIFEYVNNQIYGRSAHDAKQFIFVGKCMQELISAGIKSPEVGDVSLQQFLKVNVDRNRMNVGKIKFFMSQLSLSTPTTSIYSVDCEGDENSILDSYDVSDRYSYEYQDPENIAIDTQTLAEIYKVIAKLVKDERDAQAFLCSRYMNMSIDAIKDKFYYGESISRDTISRRLNSLAQKIAKNEDIIKIRFGINEVEDYQFERQATIASTDDLLDDIADSDEMKALYANADFNLRDNLL